MHVKKIKVTAVHILLDDKYASSFSNILLNRRIRCTDHKILIEFLVCINNLIGSKLLKLIISNIHINCNKCKQRSST